MWTKSTDLGVRMLEDKTDPDARESQTTIWQAIDEWAPQLQGWQQVLLRAAVADGVIEQDVVSEAHQRLKIENGLAELGLETKFDAIPQSSVSGRSNEPSPAPLHLVELNSLKNVNALPENSRLPIGANLTVVYGANGAGKSGYFRFIASACFSRGKRSLLPNVFQEAKGQPTGKFVVNVGGVQQEVLVTEGADPSPILKRFSVFDSATAKSHLSDNNSLGFEPAGFDVFEALKRASDDVINLLDADINRRDVPNRYNMLFSGESCVSEIVNNISSETDLEVLSSYSKFDKDEELRIEELKSSILDLRANSPESTIRSLNSALTASVELVDRVSTINDQLGEKAIARCRSLLENLRQALTAQEEGQGRSIGNPALSQTATPDWFEFAEAARKFSGKERSEYPVEDDPCLLCHRPLDAPSAELIQRLWALLDGPRRKAVTEADRDITAAVKSLSELDTSILPAGSAAREAVASGSPELLAGVDALVLALEQQRSTLLTALRSGTLEAIPSVCPTLPPALLDDARKQLENRLQKLGDGQVEKVISEYKVELQLLEHRKLLSANISDISSFIEDQKWIRTARDLKRKVNSKWITAKSTALFKEIVEGSYISNLEKECQRLKCDLPFKPKLSGQAGKTLKKLEVNTGHKTIEIFSEGEQRALAIADFLTEINLNNQAAGIILDDPVTSLDHSRKEDIAFRLAQESISRQVVVFTHDMVFLSALLERADRLKVEVTTHWVQRQSSGPGVLAVDDTPASHKAYSDEGIAERRLAEALSQSGQQQVSTIKAGAGALRRTLEEVVANRLFNQVIVRWKEQISLMKLRSVNWSQENVNEIVRLFEDISRLIDGHSNSDEFIGSPPEPVQLERLIQRVKVVRKAAKPLN